MRSIKNLLFLALIFGSAVAASAASQYPPSYRWRTITTEHFYVHYHQGENELAQRAAQIAEEAHQKLVPLMEWEPTSRTHLILADNVDASNGSATFFPVNRIEIFVSAPGADPSSPLEFYDNWLSLVIIHEYAHILHLDQAYGFGGLLRRILGRNPGTFPNAYSPPWLTEGIATLVESELTSAGRLKGTFVDMVLRTSAVEKTWFKEPQASGITPAWPGGSARYFYGSKFLEYVAQTEGFDKLAAFFHEYAATPVPFRVDAVSYDVFGSTFGEMYKAWSAEAQRNYLEDHRAISEEGLTARKRITSFGHETKYTTISPDGKLVAYGHRGPYEQATIRVHDVARNRDVETRRVNSISPVSWSPDSRRLAYSQLEFKNSFSLISDLYIWEVGSRSARQLTSGARLKDPAFTADGRSLVAVENRAGKNRLVEVDIANGAVKELFAPADYTQFSEPAISRDGKNIVVAEWVNGRIDVVLYDRDGRRVRNLTETLAISTNASPRFSADGATIYFSGDVTGVSNIYSVQTAGGNIQRITNLYGGAFFPSSNDGSTFYYTDYSGTGFDLARVDVSKSYRIFSRAKPKSLIARRNEIPDVEPDFARPMGVAERPATSKAPVQQREGSYSVWNSLRPQWWSPILASSQSETVLGAQTSGSDVLGFHQYQAQFAARLGTEQNQYDYGLIYSYDRLHPTLTAGIIQYDDLVEGVAVRGPLGLYRYNETIQRTLAQATFPYRRFNWQTYGTLGFVRDSYSEHLPFDVNEATLRDSGLFQGSLQGIRAGLAFNNTREYGYSVSPENGVLATIDYEDLNTSFGSELDRKQLRGDLRTFLRIPIRRSPLGRHVLGVRAAGGTSEGDFILQREFRVGGEDAGGLLRLDTSQFPVRGFSRSTLRGQNAALASIEYRFPLLQIDKGPAAYPVYFYRLLGDIFYDTGTAWNDEAVSLGRVNRPTSKAFEKQNTIASTGAEISVDLFFGYFIPIRYRLGAAYVLKSPIPGDEGSTQIYLTGGTSF